MSIPPFTEPARSYFVHLRELRESLESQFKKNCHILSMGMSNDFQDAIIEGSTHIRLGTTILALVKLSQLLQYLQSFLQYFHPINQESFVPDFYYQLPSDIQF